MCQGCHGNRYKEYCNLLPHDAESDLPASADVDLTITMKMAVEVISTGQSGPSNYFLVDVLRVTLGSVNGKVNIPVPQQEANNLYPGDRSVFSWDITPTEAGDEQLTFSLYAHNPHKSSTASELYYHDLTIIGQMSEPSSPRSLELSVGRIFAHLTWETPLDDGGDDLIRFNIYRGNTPGNAVQYDTVSPFTLDYNDTAVSLGESYYYQVSAENSQGESPLSSEVSGELVFAPLSPRNLQGVGGDNYVLLSWDEPLDDGGAHITSYNLYRGTTENGLSLLDSFGPSEHSINDTSVTNSNTYYYHITCENSQGESDPGSIISITPEKDVSVPTPPRDLTIECGEDFCLLKWDEPAYDGGAPLIFYKLYRGPADGERELLINIDEVYLEFNDTSAYSGVEYSYHVTVVNSAGESPPSTMVTGKPDVEVSLPSPPENLTYTESDGYVHIYWEPPANFGGGRLISFNLYRGEELASIRLYRNIHPDLNDFNDTNVTNGKVFRYYVTALNEKFESGSTNIIYTLPEEEDISDDPKDDPKPQFPPSFLLTIPDEETIETGLNNIVHFMVRGNVTANITWFVEGDVYSKGSEILEYPTLLPGTYDIEVELERYGLTASHSWKIKVLYRTPGNDDSSNIGNGGSQGDPESGGSTDYGLFADMLYILGGIGLIVLTVILVIYYRRQ